MNLRHVTHSDVTAGAQHSQSPVDAVMGGDPVSMRPQVPRAMFNIAHFWKVNELAICDSAQRDLRAIGAGEPMRWPGSAGT
jgi:hypothetical protein